MHQLSVLLRGKGKLLNIFIIVAVCGKYKKLCEKRFGTGENDTPAFQWETGVLMGAENLVGCEQAERRGESDVTL